MEHLDKNIKWFIGITLLATGIMVFYSLIISGDAFLYNELARNIFLHHDWINLITNDGAAWLDKPHFPFWITALSFRIFGLNDMAYTIPGFLFNLLGCFYTYRLANHLHHNKTIGLLSALIYLTAIDTIIIGTDIKAEAFLVGEIIPACFYWLRYDETTKIKHLLLGAFFTALAIMTKGIFTVVTISSGLVFFWASKKELYKLKQFKWFIAYCLSFIFIAPELISLYLQFGTRGIRWFFIEAQFGRFFVSVNPGLRRGPPFYFLYYFYNVFWTFFPWCFLFILALYTQITTFRDRPPADKRILAYLLGSFVPSFIMFSATRFQHSYFISILFPFASILTARTLFNLIEKKCGTHWIFKLQHRLAWIILMVIIGLNINFAVHIYTTSIGYTLILIFIIIIAFFVLLKTRSMYLTGYTRAMISSTLAVCLLFITETVLAQFIFTYHDRNQYKICEKTWVNLTLCDKTASSMHFKDYVALLSFTHFQRHVRST